MQEIFENAIKIVGLTKEDVTKTLAASGATPEDIAFILAKTTSDLSKEAGGTTSAQVERNKKREAEIGKPH